MSINLFTHTHTHTHTRITIVKAFLTFVVLFAFSFSSFSQNAIGNSVSEYAGWLHHSNSLGLGLSQQPTSLLHLHNAADPPGPFPVYMQFTNTQTTIGATKGLKIGITDYDAYINLQENANMYFLTKSLERLRITNEGYIGINNTNPLELLDIKGGNIAIRINPHNKYVLTSDANGVGTWQQITLALSSNQLAINGLSSVDLSSYLDNTDNQTLSISGHDISILNGNTITIPDNVDDADADATNEIQTISKSGSTVTLSNSGGSFTDEVDDADADATNEIQDLDLTGNILKITNNTSATNIDLGGYANIWQKNGNEIYYNNGKVGIGTANPNFALHLAKDFISTNKGATPGGGTVGAYADYLQITNTATGHVSTDGLLIGNIGNSAIIRQQENAQLSIVTNNNKGIIINTTGLRLDGEIKMPDLSTGTATHALLIDNTGKLYKATLDDVGDNLGNHIAEKTLNMAGYKIEHAKSISIKRDHSSWINMHTTHNTAWSLYNPQNSTTNPNRLLFVFNKNTAAPSYDPNNYTWNLLVLDGENGRVGIGTSFPKNELDVNGTIRCKHFKVDINNWSDFVFNSNYELMDIKELESYINTNKHLPNIPSETEMKEQGVDMAEINAKLLQKIEELTLYIIELNKKIEANSSNQ